MHIHLQYILATDLQCILDTHTPNESASQRSALHIHLQCILATDHHQATDVHVQAKFNALASHRSATHVQDDGGCHGVKGQVNCGYQTCKPHSKHCPCCFVPSPCGLRPLPRRPASLKSHRCVLPFGCRIIRHRQALLAIRTRAQLQVQGHCSFLCGVFEEADAEERAAREGASVPWACLRGATHAQAYEHHWGPKHMQRSMALWYLRHLRSPQCGHASSQREWAATRPCQGFHLHTSSRNRQSGPTPNLA
eukprot:1160138-Pelagomonas_calceolata.AAC.7